MVETLVEFLRDSAQRFGPRPAVLFKPGIRYQRWSYAQLWEESGQVATLLQQRGLQKGRQSSLVGPELPAMGVGLLRLYAGGGYCRAPGSSQRW